MKQFLIGMLVGSTLFGVAWAANGTYTLEMFNDETIDMQAMECAKAGGKGAILFDLTVDGDSYTAERTGNACLKAVK